MSDLNQINTALERLCNEDGERIVFWNDPEKEFQSTLPLVMVDGETTLPLHQCEDIKLFVKMPGWFEIDTPVVKYNSDWTIINQYDQTLYLMRETKSTKDIMKMRISEAGRVLCGRKYFEELDLPCSVVFSEDEV